METKLSPFIAVRFLHYYLLSYMTLFQTSLDSYNVLAEDNSSLSSVGCFGLPIPCSAPGSVCAFCSNQIQYKNPKIE
jgi:hypothetical protein